MGAPAVLWDEAACLDQLRALLVAACPGVPVRDIYRGQPPASPGKFGGAGGSIVILPLTPVPEALSVLGAESTAAQVQRWRVRVVTAAAGAWSVDVLGESAPFAAGGGDSAADIRTGLRAAVDALTLAVTTSVPATPSAAFDLAANVAGVSLGVSVTAPVGGAYALTVEDDNRRRLTQNWGIWRVRLKFRDVPDAAGSSTAASNADRVRWYLQASSVPVTNGLAYPYQRDNLLAAPGHLSWLRTGDPLPAPAEQENGVWVRVVAYDVDFQVPVGMTYDVPSLDALGLAARFVPTDG